MLVGFWSPKGGSGVSVVSAACALHASRSGPTTLVDLGGDQPAILGIATPSDVGCRDWLDTEGAAVSSLRRIAYEVGPTLRLLPAGNSTRDAQTGVGVAIGRAGMLTTALRNGPGSVVVDLGGAGDPVCSAVAESVDVLVIVARPCYLTIRRSLTHPLVRVSRGLVVLDEPGRALNVREVKSLINRPLLATLDVRPHIARCIDAGLVATRLPDELRKMAAQILNTIDEWQVAA